MASLIALYEPTAINSSYELEIPLRRCKAERFYLHPPYAVRSRIPGERAGAASRDSEGCGQNNSTGTPLGDTLPGMTADNSQGKEASDR